MSRIAIIIALIVFAGAFWFKNADKAHGIVVSKATISRMMDGSIMAAAEISNAGEPDVLIGASVNGFEHAHFMGAKGALVVPGGGAPVLAGDGAHVMMSGPDALTLGELVPLTLTFRDAGQVAVRAKIVEMTMDHGAMMGLDAPDVSLSLRLEGQPDTKGATGIVDIEGLTVVSRANDFGHVDGEGHGHVYLNGLKLQRLYETRFETGLLRPGDYVLQVTLNSNDHRPYLKNGVPISADLKFSIN